MIIPISDKFNDYANSVYKELKNNNIRVELDSRSEKMGAKIRNAEINKIPIMLILGEKEQKDNSISIRRKFSGDNGAMKLEKFITQIKAEISDRKNTITSK